ncbi:MAG: hypothetical protein ISS01_01325 [Nanoarchaeota archaeon]|nr:hypothetical protein [Nanoarchaeota archaeon]
MVKKKKRKKVVVHKKKKEESVHVRLDNPISKRKRILQTAVMTVELLKKYEVVRELRKEKVKEMDKLRVVLSDIKKMTKRIKVQDLPKVKGIEEKHKEHKIVMKAKNIEKHEKIVKVHKSGIESQLDELRRKLETL